MAWCSRQNRNVSSFLQSFEGTVMKVWYLGIDLLGVDIFISLVFFVFKIVFIHSTYYYVTCILSLRNL